MLDYSDREYHIKHCDGNKSYQSLLRSKIYTIIAALDSTLSGTSATERVYVDSITEAIMDKTYLRPGFSFVVKADTDMLGQIHICVDVAGMNRDIVRLCKSLAREHAEGGWFNNE